jgi:hypothetical protein
MKIVNKITAWTILLLVIMSVLRPINTLAVEESILVIDNNNLYQGMAKTYSQGYLPKVEGGRVNVLLPLRLSNALDVTALKNDTITVTLDLGNPENSPFVFGNYESTVGLKEHTVNNGAKKVSTYLVNLSLPLDSDRKNGKYPIAVKVKYMTLDGTPGEQIFTVYVTIKDGTDPNAPSTPVITPKQQPKVIISKYKVTPEVAEAGEEFDVSFTLENTSDSVNVQNLKITLKPEGTDLIVEEQSNTKYLKSLGKDKTKEFKFHLKVRQDAQPKPQKIIVNLEYEDSEAKPIATSEEILVQVKQPIRIKFDTPNIPAAVNAGDTLPLSLNVFNMGKSTLNNVMCRVEASGLMPEGSSFLGNMEPGASKTAEIFVFVGTKDMSKSEEGEIIETPSEDGEKYGKASGVIHITYEDEFGKEYKEDISFDTNINPPSVPETAPQTEVVQPKASQWWISVVIAAIIIAGIVVVMVLAQRKRKKKVQMYEAD